MKGYNAMLVDNEYKRKKAFLNKTRQKCKDIKCVDCKYQNVCLESGINDEV